MSSWEFKQSLPALQANLTVRPSSWFIERYFPGPDLRYNGYFFRIGSLEVYDFAANLRKTWEKFQATRVRFAAESGLEVSGFGRSKIYLRHVFGTGITLDGHRGLISDNAKLESILNELESAPKRAKAIQVKLRGL
jgi:hypothetical protein